jgi:hypothetical protein
VVIIFSLLSDVVMTPAAGILARIIQEIKIIQCAPKRHKLDAIARGMLKSDYDAWNVLDALIRLSHASSATTQWRSSGVLGICSSD